MTPRDEILPNNKRFFLCLQTVECLWQDFNDSTSAAFWQASLAMDETNNSKSAVKSSLTSQDWTFHLNILLGIKGGFSEQLFRIWHDNKEESFLTAPPCTFCSADTRTQVAWGTVGPCTLFYVFVGRPKSLWVSLVHILSPEGTGEITLD